MKIKGLTEKIAAKIEQQSIKVSKNCFIDLYEDNPESHGASFERFRSVAALDKALLEIMLEGGFTMPSIIIRDGQVVPKLTMTINWRMTGDLDGEIIGKVAYK